MIKRLREIRGKAGFSLLEGIISIAVIAIFGGFILQIFIVSENANERARDMDYASAAASSMIEEMKSITPEKFKLYADSDGGVVFYYNDDWELLQKNGESEGRFELRALAYQDALSGVFDISVAVVDLNAEGDKRELVNYETSKYFPAD